MSIFFDSPIAYCPVANRYVLLDQTRDDCAREMHCSAPNCPLAKDFADSFRPGNNLCPLTRINRDGSK